MSAALEDAKAAAKQAASKRGRSNRAKGKWFEQKVSAWLREHGFPHAESAQRQGWRTAEHVSADPFDLLGVPGVLWSLKYAEASEDQAVRWLDEVHTAATERGLTGVLVWKRRGTGDLGLSWAYRYVEVAGLEVAVRMRLCDLADVLRAEGYGQSYVPGESEAAS